MAASAASPAPLSVPGEHVICSEILSVTSAMRKNSRWAASTQTPLYARDDALAASLGLRRTGMHSGPSSVSARQEVQLMAGFLDLRREVRSSTNISELPLPTLLSPFFAIIRSPLSTGPITSAALASLYTFFVSGFIRPDSKQLEAALGELSHTVSHCKFEASDASGDEVVMYRIMAVIEQCVCGEAGDRLGDIEVCEMLETVLTTCCQMRLSEILRRYAESTMHAIVRRIFGRLRTLNPIDEEKKLLDADNDVENNELRMNVQASEQSIPEEMDKTTEPPPETEEKNEGELESEQKEAEPADRGEQKYPPADTGFVRSDYGLPSILELLRVLINILDPSDRLHTDSTRLAALRVLNTAFEVAGASIGSYPSLMALIQDFGCKYMFQLASSENPNVLYTSLRTISTMLETLNIHLKLQQELFLTFTIDRLAYATPSRSQIAQLNQQRGLVGSPRPGSPMPGTPDLGKAAEGEEENIGRAKPGISPAKGEIRVLLMETLNHVARKPSFMVDLFSNYDCDANSEDLFEKLIEYLTKGVYTPYLPNGREVAQQTSQLLCLDLLLDFVKHMTDRVTESSEEWPSEYPAYEDLLQEKSRKKLILTGASKFNTKPKLGLSFLEENKLIYADLSETTDKPKSLAIFLKNCNRLDKRLLGDFISRPENMDTLKAFIRLFDFKDKPVAEALRELLESFRLPGESQQIARITEAFAEVYFTSKPADIKSQDAVHVLTYSIIMLNTDQHSPQVRKRMTFEDYSKNLRGVNEGTNFPPEFLSTVFESIRKREIVMPEEQAGQVGFGYAWKELLVRTRTAGQLRSRNTNLFDGTMFTAVWKNVLASIAFAFTTFDDDYTVERAIAGFRQMAILAGHFGLPEVLDNIVITLSQVSSLVPDTLITHVPFYPVVEVEGQDVTVSSLSVKFGSNFKGQLAAVVLFTIVNGNGNAIRDGWVQVFEIYQNLYLHSLLPSSLLKMEGFLGGSGAIPLHGKQPPPRQAGRNEGGLLSALSSYLLTPYSGNTDPIPEATDSEIENTLSTIDCLNACRLNEFYGQLFELNSDAFVSAIRALEALAHERTVARLKQEVDEVVPISPNPRRGPPAPQTLSYDPAAVYLLETIISLVSKQSQYLEETWPIVYEHLSALLASASNYNSILVERAVAGLWRLMLIISDSKPSIRDQLYLSLDLLGNLPPAVTNSVGEQLLDGLVLFVKKNRESIRSQTEWGLVFALMRSAIRSPSPTRQSYELLISLTADGPDQCVTQDNFSGLVSLLEEYVVLAGKAVESTSYHDKRRNAESPLELTIQRAKQSVDLLFDIKKFIPRFVERGTPSDQIWRQCSLPLLSTLGRQSTNAAREVRHAALIHLQRILLGQQIIPLASNNLPLSREAIDTIFERILFPLLDELLRPDIAARDARGMPETRLRASALLCKVFVALEVQSTPREVNEGERDIRVLWVQILDLLDRLMNVDKRDQLYEAIPESLKNVVLVMNALDILVPPPPIPSIPDPRSERQRELWHVTHERLQRFLPGFLDEVLPPAPAPTSAGSQALPALMSDPTTPVPASPYPSS